MLFLEDKKGSVKVLVVDAVKKIKYTYLKKHRYLDPYLQDLIADKTNFKPYKIKLLYASKENKKLNEFNYFKFIYEGLTYELLDKKLKVINE